MLNFPKSTYFGQKIPKQKFYDKIEMLPPSAKRVISEDIESIVWKYKLSPKTISIAEGKNVKEIDILEIAMRKPLKDDIVIQQIDIKIDRYILFIVKSGLTAQIWVCYKEKLQNQSSKDSARFKVTAYYHTEPVPEEELELTIDGLDMDAVYENFIRQVESSKLFQDRKKPLKSSVECDEKCKKIQKKIDALEKKAMREKQWNLQMEIDEQIRDLKKEIEELKNGY